MVHSEEDFNAAMDASAVLFGNSDSGSLKNLDEETLLAVFEGMPSHEISLDELKSGIKVLTLFTEKAPVFTSKGEMRKMIQAGGFSINKEKWTEADGIIDTSYLLNDHYLIAQKGKKNYFLLKAI